MIREHTLAYFAHFMGVDTETLEEHIKSLAARVEMATWNGLTSFGYLGKGLVSGMIDVLPDESFLSNCKQNATDMYDSL